MTSRRPSKQCVCVFEPAQPSPASRYAPGGLSALLCTSSETSYESERRPKIDGDGGGAPLSHSTRVCHSRAPPPTEPIPSRSLRPPCPCHFRRALSTSRGESVMVPEPEPHSNQQLFGTLRHAVRCRVGTATTCSWGRKVDGGRCRLAASFFCRTAQRINLLSIASVQVVAGGSAVRRWGP